MSDPYRRRQIRRAAEKANATLSVHPRARRSVVLVPTCERVGLCGRLLDDLASMRKDFDSLIVLDDASEMDYGHVADRVRGMGGTYLRWDQRRGKRRYWQTVSRLFGEAAKLKATEIVFLADDMRLCKDFFGVARRAWDQIDDPRKAVLNIHLDTNRVGSACWTGIQPHRKNGGTCSGWTDGVFIAPGRFLRLVPLVPEIDPARWAGQTGKDELGSGVWQYVSQKLVDDGYNIYQSEQSLTVHGAGPSSMNQRRRLHVSITTHDFIDGPGRARTLALGAGAVVASMATFPERKDVLRRTVESLLPQVDQLVVYLNYGNEPAPDFLSNPKVTTYHSATSGFGDLCDMGKFYPSKELLGAKYILTVDDDLLYSPDYVERLLHFVEIHRRRSFVGYHGIELLGGARENYYHQRTVHHCRYPVPESKWVHVLGTGVLAFARELVELPRTLEELQPGRRMADVWLGALAQRQGIPMRLIAHTGSEIVQQPLPPGTTLYEQMKHQSGAQRALVEREWPWQLHTIGRGARARTKRTAAGE